MSRWTTSNPVTCIELLPGLRAFSTSWKVGGADKRLHSYYLAEGGVLIDGPDRVSFYKEHAATFEPQGIRWQLLTHGADASPACAHVASTFGARPYIHEADAEYASRKAKAAITGSFNERHKVCPGIEAIPLPGHTAGFTAYLWTSALGRYLFCGDIVYRDNKGWSAFLNKGLHEIGADSLSALRAVDCDALLPNETWGEPQPPIPFGPHERNALIDEVLARVRTKYKVTPR